MVLEKHFSGMPKIKVRLFANFREFAGTGELELEGGTMGEILEKICKRFHGLEELMFENGKLRPYVNIFLNGMDVTRSGGLDYPVQAGDEIAIFPPVSGG